jgi:hypothetical protein
MRASLVRRGTSCADPDTSWGQGHLSSRPASGPELERFLLAGAELRATA